MIEKIKGLIENTQGIVELAWVQYKPQIERIVDALKERKNAPERDIERLLDGILDFCFDERFRAKFDEICLLSETLYPQLSQSYKSYVVDLWDKEHED